MTPPQPPYRYQQAETGTKPQAEAGTREEEAMLYCPVCSMKLESRKCKLFCAQCGYYMSCADYY